MRCVRSGGREVEEVPVTFSLLLLCRVPVAGVAQPQGSVQVQEKVNLGYMSEYIISLRRYGQVHYEFSNKHTE